jgi:hypothetical protein
MAQFYTLEEAARVLGMSAEELKAKAQSREVRAFLDGGSWRFRVVDVDELARRRGLGSDAELRLSDLEVPAASSGSGEMEDLDLSEFHLGVAKPDLGAESAHISKVAPPGSEKSLHDSGSDHDFLIDDLTVPPNQITGSSSVIIGAPSSGRHPSDSDVRLVPEMVKGSSDSDVQLASPNMKQPSDSDVTLIKDDTGDHKVVGSGSSSSETAVTSSPLLGSSAEVPASPASDSDFDLNPSSELIDALQPDSGSDFELSALDSSDEFESTPLSKPSDSDVTASDPKLAGINLSRPSDSGINLQTGAGLGLGKADSIELAPLSDDELKTTAPPSARPAKPRPSLAATPPPAVAKGQKDIFDDTDFEVDVPLEADSDDKTVQLEAASDFDLEDSDTGSEVFAIDEEAVDQNASTAMAPSAYAEEDEAEEEDAFDSAVSSEMASAWSTPDSAAGVERSGPAMVLARESEPEWSGLWVGLLGFTAVCLFFAAFVAHDLVRNLYEFQSGGTMGSGLVSTIARMFGG